MDGRKDVKIEFLGLFDTVEAFGVPIEELRVAIDWAIWPISFRNYRLSDKVKHACQALALDDERTTFHPLRIDQADLAEGQIVKEVWFAGSHSDIGGGYPESTLSFVPLVWMAEQLGDQLRFQDGTIARFREYQSAIGPMHDSRSGAGVLYRYGPRPIHDRVEDGGPPVVHFGVVERMLHGCDNYAPLMLPANAKVLLPDGQVLPLTRDETRKAMRSAYAKREGDGHRAAEADAFMAMSPPNPEMARQVLDTVWWRRFAYFSLLIALGILVAWPWIARSVVGSSKEHGLEGTTLLKWITAIDNGTSTVVKPFADLLASVLPSYAAPWLAIALYYPTVTTVLVIIILIAWNRNAALRDSIQERARLAWYRPDRMASRRRVSKSGWLLAIGRWMRLHAWPVRMAFTNVLMPAVFLIAIFGSALLLLSRGYLDWRAGVGDFCKSSASTHAVGDTPVDGARRRIVRRQRFLLAKPPRGREGPQIPRLDRDGRSVVRPHHHDRPERIQDPAGSDPPPRRPAPAAAGCRLVPAGRADRRARIVRSAAAGHQRTARRTSCRGGSTRRCRPMRTTARTTTRSMSRTPRSSRHKAAN